MQLSIPGILGELVAKEDKRGELNVSRFPSLHPIMRLKAVLDRRLQKRTRTDIPVTVYRDSLSYPATLCDISSHGIGLREIGQLRVGDVALGRSEQLGHQRPVRRDGIKADAQ